MSDLFLTNEIMKPTTALLLFATPVYIGLAQTPGAPGQRWGEPKYTLDNCVNHFDISRIESTRAGYQYWFADRGFADGKTLKLSVVRPHEATHPPHMHNEDEFFFVLEGTAEVYLDGRTKVVGAYTSFYCPPASNHGIRNVGDTDLKYLVVKKYDNVIDIDPFWDSSHHWYDILDQDRFITPERDQRRYSPANVAGIAENILLFQKVNGGWPKNYDMLAILTDQQRTDVLAAAKELNTTFDNGATHSQVAYLARAYATLKDVRYRTACLRGLDFILQAQYVNGGWPQFYPDTSGYRKFVTFNDGAMAGVMRVLHDVVRNDPVYAFVDEVRRGKARRAFERGIDCILRCQIREEGELTVWGQQHDNIDFRPRGARTFEPAALCSQESAEIVLFLMSIDHPSSRISEAIEAVAKWFEASRIPGIRVKTIDAPAVKYEYHSTASDRVVEKDPDAPPIWARYYELGTRRPLFSNRDGVPVYSLAEVERERRTGYVWYTYAPQEVLKQYPLWRSKSLMDRSQQK